MAYSGWYSDLRKQDQQTQRAAATKRTIAGLEAEARAIATQGRETKEQAFARLLEADPQVYADYRAKHNAKALLASLEAAGVQLAVRQ